MARPISLARRSLLVSALPVLSSLFCNGCVSSHQDTIIFLPFASKKQVWYYLVCFLLTTKPKSCSSDFWCSKGGLLPRLCCISGQSSRSTLRRRLRVGGWRKLSGERWRQLDVLRCHSAFADGHFQRSCHQRSIQGDDLLQPPWEPCLWRTEYFHTTFSF